MQKAETVLSILKQKSKQDESHRYDRIYRNLFNEDFFLRAYQKIHAKQGNMTPGTDGTTIDGFSRKQISQLIELLKWERYQPKPVRRTYIPKKNGKMRPLGIPAFADKLVQEVVRQILEAIYEPIFSDNSHGFRPNRSCHTALYQIKSTCRGTNWVIEGDITGCFDHIDHDIQRGDVAISEGKTLRDYITEYLSKAKDDQIHRVAVALGVDEVKLRTIMSLRLNSTNINEFGRYDDLKKTVNKAKAKEYFEKIEGTKIIPPKVNVKVDNLLREFILGGGFEIEMPE